MGLCGNVIASRRSGRANSATIHLHAGLIQLILHSYVERVQEDTTLQ